MQVAGTLRVGEAAPIAARVRRRMNGSSIVHYTVAVVPPIMAGFLGGMIESELWLFLGRPNGDVVIGYFIGAALGWLIWRPFYLKWAIARFRKAFLTRGLRDEAPLSLEIEPEGLRYTVGGVEQRAHWRVVTELFRVPGYWVFLVQGSAFFAPDRFFPDAAAQRTFVAEALARMTEDARSRSTSAQAFARPVTPAP